MVADPDAQSLRPSPDSHSIRRLPAAASQSLTATTGQSIEPRQAATTAPAPSWSVFDPRMATRRPFRTFLEVRRRRGPTTLAPPSRRSAGTAPYSDVPTSPTIIDLLATNPPPHVPRPKRSGLCTQRRLSPAADMPPGWPSATTGQEETSGLLPRTRKSMYL
jgi:hypothetical protein